MKSLMLHIECEDSVNLDNVVKAAMKLFLPEKGIKGVSIADQSSIDFSREKRLNEYFDQVDYNLNCLKDKLYKIRRYMR